jgi:hypothetical protein
MSLAAATAGGSQLHEEDGASDSSKKALKRARWIRESMSTRAAGSSMKDATFKDRSFPMTSLPGKYWLESVGCFDTQNGN